MTVKLPLWNKNSAILHSQLNQIAEAVERSSILTVDTSTGLQLNETATVRTIGLVPQRVAAYAVVAAGGITAASGLTLGTGKVDVYYKDDNGVLQPCKGPSDDCFNSTSATAMQGDVIQVKWIDDDWAWDVASCPT